MENWEAELNKVLAEAEEKKKAAQSQPPEGETAKKDSSDGFELFPAIRALVATMAVLVLLFTFVARIIVVSGPSMENTLIEGDLILVWSLGYTPRVGDVVVLTQRSYQEDSIVKRVIAAEGQQVDINYSSGTLLVDGEAVEEDYIKEQMRTPSFGEGNNHVLVPEGYIFVMGDNRNLSADSRYPAIGLVDERCVIGRGVLVLFPFHHWKGL